MFSKRNRGDFPFKTPAQTLRKFHKDEDGVMIIFGLFIFVAMILLGGMAIDLMRYENARSAMQNTADRAALAAASLRIDHAQGEDEFTREDVVNAYFAAEGIDNYILQVDTSSASQTDSHVRVVPGGSLPSLFLNMLGIDDLNVVTPATAGETIAGGAKLELVLVIDVSGSMNGSRIAAVRDAASEMVEGLMSDIDLGDVAISLVPYSSFTAPGPLLSSYFTNYPTTDCVNFRSNEYRTTALPMNTTAFLPHNCSAQQALRIFPFMSDVTTITNRINALTANGGTNTSQGVRWAASLLDPAMRPIVQSMIAVGEIDPVFDGRPADFGSEEVIKALVLMTDGNNNAQSSNTYTLETCTAIKEQGALMFTIAYDAPSGGVSLMQNCATSASHYFDTSSTEILNIFAGIGNTLHSMTLRLTE
jgi:Mg-chelatase subunit ChlD